MSMNSQKLFENQDVMAVPDMTPFYIKQVHMCIKNTINQVLLEHKNNPLKITQSQRVVKFIRLLLFSLLHQLTLVSRL